MSATIQSLTYQTMNASYQVLRAMLTCGLSGDAWVMALKGAQEIELLNRDVQFNFARGNT